jgi:hypothetical protein
MQEYACDNKNHYGAVQSVARSLSSAHCWSLTVNFSCRGVAIRRFKGGKVSEVTLKFCKMAAVLTRRPSRAELCALLSGLLSLGLLRVRACVVCAAAMRQRCSDAAMQRCSSPNPPISSLKSSSWQWSAFELSQLSWAPRSCARQLF